MLRPAPPDTARPPTAATPMAFARAIVRAYALRGMDPSAALDQAQIAPSRLHKPDGRITARQMELLSGAAMRELDDEGLGAFGRRLPWGSYGMLARASLSAPDLGLALRRWCRHHGLLTSDIALHLRLLDDGSAELEIEEHTALGDAREFCLVHVLRNIHGLACWYVDSRIPLAQARFPYAPPPHARAYPLLFALQLRWQAPRAAIRFDARYLALPIRRDERAMRQMLQRALPLTVLQYRRDRLLVPRVRQVLLAQPQHSHNAEGIATQLAISVRTLHRQLRDEGATLQQIKDEVRREHAQQLLWRTAQPLKQIAQATGFRNEKSFTRAFRAWTGQSPGAFRRGGSAMG
ncbi:MAG: AraC family transcriptional regulator [Burkholderiaceae bacterium]